MTIKEIEELMEDTRRLPRVPDKVALSAALASLEIARQLMILNEHLTSGGETPKAKGSASSKKR